ncbi:hypothetical protein KM043_011629 [Ampulex compressa]|nr:hypothetical protein KM043_011629 [Ampulex compressa]
MGKRRVRKEGGRKIREERGNEASPVFPGCSSRGGVKTLPRPPIRAAEPDFAPTGFAGGAFLREAVAAPEKRRERGGGRGGKEKRQEQRPLARSPLAFLRFSPSL